jgi:hypothetical protein
MPVHPIKRFSALTLLTFLLTLATATLAQDYGARLGTVQRGGRLSYEPTGPGILFDALDPAVRKWYVPQELYSEYQWRQSEYNNYARQNYQRYVNTSLEGDYYYDTYGNFLTQGWLVYDWRQRSPQPFGSSIERSNRFNSWFNSLVIASDHKGQYHYAITIGSQIRTTLTPMTFSKPLFDGLQWDFAADKYDLTLLMSRISEPSSPGNRPEDRTNNTNLFASCGVIQIGDFVKVGGTLVNAHQSQTQLETVNGNIFQGRLTESQNFGNVSTVEVRLRDDSSADRVGGAALFSSDILIWDLEDQRLRGSEIGFRAEVEGGFPRQGFLAADGTEEIILRYDFLSPFYAGPDPTEIKRVQIELVIANDYRIDIASDRQLDTNDQVVFLPVERANGNVRDGSNQRVLVFDYGLPTANQITGFTLELTDLDGLYGYMEFNLNHRFRQFPNPNIKNHHATNERSHAWIMNLSKIRRPYYGFFEAFSIEEAYNTSITIADAEGALNYGNELAQFEFVEDNDDQDRRHDWAPGDDEVFPGWDENNDFISDFN